MINYLILCGGSGKRFQQISTTIPKILIEIRPGITMLDWLIEEYLPRNSKVILATGHLKDSVEEFVGKKWYRKNIVLSQEEKKLGTGGALLKASRLVETDNFIAINGDTIQELEIENFINNSGLLKRDVINIGCTTSDLNDSGKLLVGPKDFIISFSEKKLPHIKIKKGFKICTSLGMYRCKTEYFRSLPVEPKSLEDDILPFLVKNKSARASVFKDKFHDFGTFDRYNKLIGK